MRPKTTSTEPCPFCGGRMDIIIRHGLPGYSIRGLACQKGCDPQSFNGPFWRSPCGGAWFPSVESCVKFVDETMRREKDEVERLYVLTCSNCGRHPHVTCVGRRRYQAECLCTTRREDDLRSALCAWSNATGAYRASLPKERGKDKS